MTKLMICYGSPESVRSLEGDSVLVGEVHTALFTAAAIERRAPHDCDPSVWLDWCAATTWEGDKFQGISGGSDACPCDEESRCPMGVGAADA